MIYEVINNTTNEIIISHPHVNLKEAEQIQNEYRKKGISCRVNLKKEFR